MRIKTVGFDQLFVACDVLTLRSKTKHIVSAIEQVAWADAVYPFGEYITHQSEVHDCGNRCLERLGALVLGRADWYLANINSFVIGMPFWVTDPLVRELAEEDWLASSISLVSSDRLVRVQTRTLVNWQGIDITTDVVLGQMPYGFRPDTDAQILCVSAAKVWLSEARDAQLGFDHYEEPSESE